MNYDTEVIHVVLWCCVFSVEPIKYLIYKLYKIRKNI